MDKNVTVCDLPEIVVCYKEKTYHVVKDICADEGVLVQEKSVTCNSNSNSNLCESEDLANRDVEISSRDEVATSENVLKEYLTLEDVLLRKSPPQSLRIVCFFIDESVGGRSVITNHLRQSLP
ncbi:hypothetical protein YC2023_025096 [Brassica napus]